MRSPTLVAVVCLVGLLAGRVCADCYMQHPRGSNNRLNEANAQRNNNNRIFDSQNNNRGGYNVGDKTDNAAGNDNNANVDNPTETFNPDSITTNQMYQMVYYEGSQLQIEWTTQHGCGGNDVDDTNVNNCNMVLQYICDGNGNVRRESQAGFVTVTDPSMSVDLRDGSNTNQVNTDGTADTNGMHENARYYTECTTRDRNKGLFTADQNLNGNTARFTRQNPNGGRSGLECPEERDYYPYWRPTPFRDIAYLTDHVELCPYIAANSENNNNRFKCYDPATNPSATILSKTTKDSCADAGGQWVYHSWSLPAPVCQQAGWSRFNQLGNGRDTPQMLHFNWTLPLLSELVDTNPPNAGVTGMYVKCALRLRYNISTDDYDPWNINATYNGAANSPVTNNPTVDVGASMQGLKLAINTNQFGRTFQDRSHTFYIRARPAALAGANIINLNVRGKRGNIVQTYPAHEYDFVPNRLHLLPTDYIHIQWTGSNTHNNGGDGGDGQTGDAGEGTGGTDRHNFVQMGRQGENYPLPLDKYDTNNIFSNSYCWRLDGTTIGTRGGYGTTLTNTDCAVWLATSGYFRAVNQVTGATNGDDGLNPTLNNAPASLVGGVVMRIPVPGQYNYMSTRNNNFSNRSQKGTLIVSAPAA